MSKKPAKKHRHKWIYDHEDCSRRGGGGIRFCDGCTTFEEYPKKKK